jgi:hypothetical protein
MKYKIGDILCYEDTFENTIVDSVHFLITDVDKRYYYVICLEGDEGEADPNEIYNINMIDSSPKWKKITE